MGQFVVSNINIGNTCIVGRAKLGRGYSLYLINDRSRVCCSAFFQLTVDLLSSRANVNQKTHLTFFYRKPAKGPCFGEDIERPFYC